MKSKYLLLAIVAVLVVQACKKEDSSDPAPSYTTTAPTSDDYLYGVRYTDQGGNGLSESVWTLDGLDVTIFTDQFKAVSAINICNSTIVLANYNNGQTSISYAELSDLKKFKTVKSSRWVGEVAIIDGVIVCSAVDGNNTYNGHCDTKNGESEVTFDLLPSGTLFLNMKLLNNLLIADVPLSTSNGFAYSSSGSFWNITSAPLNGANYWFSDGKYWASSSSQWAYTDPSDPTFSNWTIESIPTNQKNTTDTIGSFYENGSIIATDSEWKIYGTIYSNISGFHYPCVNVSLDKGQTWNTSFLTGISKYSNNTSMGAAVYATNDLTIIDHRSSNGTINEGVYSSANGIDFVMWTDQSKVDQFRNIQNIKSKD